MIDIPTIPLDILVTKSLADLGVSNKHEVQELFQRVRREGWKEYVVWRAMGTRDPEKFVRRLRRLYERVIFQSR